MMTLDQIRSIGAYAPDHTSKVQHNSKSQDTILKRLMDFAASVPDFRRLGKGNIRHRLSDIIILLIFGQVSKQARRADIIKFGQKYLNKFRKIGMFKNGIPSEATLCRVEQGIDDLALANKMQEFIEIFHTEQLRRIRDREVICIDGKAERGTVQENGRNPDIVSAYSFNFGITLATEACQEKSNEIKAVPQLLDKLDISGKIVTADAMSMQKDIVDKIRDKRGDFLIELKANQRALRYGVEDRLKEHTPLYSYTDGPELNHGRIETRTYRIYDGLDIIADKKKWGGNLTIIEYKSDTIRKSTGEHTFEKRLYMSSLPTSTPAPGRFIRYHWAIESMHWCLDCNLEQDKLKRKYPKSARNLDTIQRIICSLFSIWKWRRKKQSDKKKRMTELMTDFSLSFTNLMQFMNQK